MTATLTTRNATLADLKDILVDQQGRKLDIVVSPRDLLADEGHLVIKNTEPIISADGVTVSAGRYQPTNVCEEGIAEKLRIPRPYLSRMRDERAVELWDLNVNGWLERTTPNKRFLVRALRGSTRGTGKSGIARALLSDGYKRIDNLDVLLAALDGLRRTGLDVTIDGCDLTERRMYVRVVAPQIQALAPRLLRNYRSPFTGEWGANNPVMFAGFVLTNSETGCGAFSIVPRIVAQVCSNGYTITRDAERNVHLGGRLEEGVVTWSQKTHEDNLTLIASKASDTVRQFLDPDYLTRKVAEMERDAGAPVVDPPSTIKVLGEKLAFSQQQRNEILDHFIKGADPTAGGIMHAITSTARIQDNADTAHDMESKALHAMTLAARA